MTRAANVDLFVETGTDWARLFTLWQPTGEPIKSQDVQVNMRLYVDELPQLVYRVTPQGGGTLIHFGQGLWWQPTLWLPDDELIMPAQAVPILDARAAWETVDATIAIPFTISPDGTQVTLHYTSDESSALVRYVGVWRWDLLASTLDYGWVRLAQGSLSIIDSTAEPLSVTPYPGVVTVGNPA